MTTRSWMPLLAALAIALPAIALENETDRRDQLRRLRSAVEAYEVMHPGKTPRRVSELVDENLVAGPAALVRPGSTAVPARAELDARADYTFELLPGAVDLVIREKAPLRNESVVLAIFKDGSIRALPVTVSPTATTMPSSNRADSRPTATPASPPAAPAPPYSSMPGPALPTAPQLYPGSSPTPASKSRPYPPPPGLGTAPSGASSPTDTRATTNANASRPSGIARPTTGQRATPPSTRPSSQDRAPTWPAGAQPPSPPIPDPSGGSATHDSAGVARPDAPANAYAIMLEAARQMQAQARAMREAGSGRENTQQVPIIVVPVDDVNVGALPFADQDGARRGDPQVRISRSPDGTVTYSVRGFEPAERGTQQTFTSMGPRQVQLPPGIVKEDADAPWDAVGRLLEIDRKQAPADLSATTEDRGPGRLTTPATPPPVVGTKWRVTRQFVQGQPWHSGAWSKAQVDAANEAGHKAERLKEYAKVIRPFTDVAGWALAQDRENNQAEKLLESVAHYQERYLGRANSAELAHTRNNIGVVYTASRTYGAAEEEFVKAQRIWESLTPANAAPSEDFAVMLHNFSVLREKQGNLADATRLEAMAEAILAKRRAAGLP